MNATETNEETEGAELYSAPNNPALADPAKPEYALLYIGQISPSGLNPRKHFDAAAHDELVASVLQHGIMQPIVVRRQNDTDFGTYFEIIMGERRYLAAKDAKLTKVPAIIRDGITDEQLLEMAMLENVQRQSLTPLEEANGYQRMLEMNQALKQGDLAKRLGVPQPTIANSLRLLQLPAGIQLLLDKGDLKKSHGVALASLADNPLKCTEFALQAVQEQMPESRLQEQIRAFKATEAARNQPSLLDLEEDHAEEAGAVHAASVNEQAEAKPQAESTVVAADAQVPTVPATDAAPALPDTAGAPVVDGTSAPASVDTGAEQGGIVAVESAKPAPAAAPVAAPSPAAKPTAPATPPRPAAMTGLGIAPEVPNTNEEKTESAPVAAPAPVQKHAPAVQEDGERVSALILQSDDDWLFEVGFDIDQAFAELRGVWAMSLTSLGRKCLKALTDKYNSDHPADEPVTPVARLEAILVARAQDAGFDIDTLREIPE